MSREPVVVEYRLMDGLSLPTASTLSCNAICAEYIKYHRAENFHQEKILPSALVGTALCKSLDSVPGHSNWGLTNQRREESRAHTNTLLSLVNSKSNVGAALSSDLQSTVKIY